MSRMLLWFWLLQSTLFGCATCAMMTPMTEISITLHGAGTHIDRAAYRWRFSEIYSTEIVMQFDYNKNGVLDADELDEIKALKIDYLLPRQMLLSLTYAASPEQNASAVASRFERFELYAREGHLYLTFDARMDLTMADAGVLTFFFEDREGFFDLRVSDAAVTGLELNATANPYLNMAAMQFGGQVEAADPGSALAPKQPVETEKPVISDSWSERLIASVKRMLERVRDEHSLSAILLLLLFAYGYGLIHALGPGHGKTLVGSYFLGNERSYARAASVALAIGVVHTFSAFLLTVTVYFIIQGLLSQFMDDAVKYTTYLSAVTIIAIALWLLIKKIRLQRTPATYRFSAGAVRRDAALRPNTQPLAHASSCGCASCKVDHHSTDAALIISAGIVPCPGTVTLFIFALSMGLYAVGFLSALVMSLGMSTIIFVSAAASVLIRKRALNTHAGLKRVMEYVSLVIILLLGAALFFL